MKKNSIILTTALTAAGFLLAYKSLSSSQAKDAAPELSQQVQTPTPDVQNAGKSVLEGPIVGGQTIDIPVAAKATEAAEPQAATNTTTGQSQAADEEMQIEEQLLGNLQKDEKVLKEAEINSIDCSEKNCTIDASAKKEDDSHFQMAFVEFLQKHPQFGNKIDIKPSPDNPRNVAFVYYKD